MKRIDIHNIAKATAQQVFDFIANHLLTQNQQCRSNKDGNGFCQYRRETGPHKKVLKCAAGCLIPRRNYQEVFEGKLWHGVLNSLEDKARAHDDLVASFQHIHDHKKPDQWKVSLRELAVNKGLKSNF